MWVVYSRAGEQGLRLTKGVEVEADTRYYLQPGKTYKAARSTEDTDFYLTHKRHSRKDVHFSLTASKVEPQDTLIGKDHDKDRSRPPIYEVELKCLAKGVWIVPPKGEEVEVTPGSSIIVKDAMQIRLLKYQNQDDTDSFIFFEWRPTHIYHRMAKKNALEQIQQTCASIGISFSNSTSTPSFLHTHYLVPKVQPDPVPLMALASIHQQNVVAPLWLDNLVQAALSSDGKRSKLEEDFLLNWPPESDCFPPVEGKGSNRAELGIWQPNAARSAIFEGVTFVDYSSDPIIVELLTAAQGKVVMPSLASSQAFTKDLNDFRKAQKVKQDSQTFVLLPFGANLPNAEDLPMIRSVAESCSITGFIDARDIMTAIVEAKRITEGSISEQDSPSKRPPAPTPSAPIATAEISFPATHPDDHAMKAPKLGQTQGEGSAGTAGTKPSKKPRRIADKAPIDPFASMFEDTAPAPPSAQINRERSETQLASSMDIDNASMGSNASSSKPQSFVPREGSKYAKLKRRAGTNGISQNMSIDEADTSMHEDEPPSKKIKSFDPDVESVASQASQALQRKKKQQEEERNKQLANIAEEEEVPSTATAKKAVPAKRKAAETVPESEDEAEQASSKTQPSKKKTKESTEASKKLSSREEKAALKATQAAEQAKYLQVASTKRKMTKTDAGFNEEFNKLKIVKPLAKESHKIGWNERDIIQEELEEDTNWEPDDNATFFQVRFVSMVRPDLHVQRPQVSVDPRYAGKPNFKAFRPKNNKIPQGDTAVRRQNIALKAVEPLGYGLTETYNKQTNDDSDEDIEMPMADTASKKKGKGKAKATQSKKPPPKKAASRKKQVVSDSEEDEMDDDDASRTSTAREESVPAATQKRGKQQEALTIDSDSDEDTGRTFGGFGSRTQRSTGRRR